MAVVAAAAIIFCIVTAYKHHQKEKRSRTHNTLAAKWLAEEKGDVIYVDDIARDKPYEGLAHNIDGKQDAPRKQYRLTQASRSAQASTISGDSLRGYVNKLTGSNKVIA